MRALSHPTGTTGKSLCARQPPLCQTQSSPEVGGLSYRPAGLAFRGYCMASILPFLRETMFNSEVTRIMGEAYDFATAGLRDTGQPAVVQEIIAQRIIDLVGSGERDPQKLANLALQSLGIAAKQA
jgi:hypothetical protein